MQGQELKAARKALGMTQTQLADELALSSVFISMMESGKREIERRTELSVRYLLLTKADGLGKEGQIDISSAG